MVRLLAPIAPGGENGIGHHGSSRAVNVGNPGRIDTGVHVKRRRAVDVDRHNRGPVVTAPRLPVRNDPRIVTRVGKGETVAGVGNIQPGAAGTVEVNGLRGGNRTNPRHDERNQGGFHGYEINKAHGPPFASRIPRARSGTETGSA